MEQGRRREMKIDLKTPIQCLFSPYTELRTIRSIEFGEQHIGQDIMFFKQPEDVCMICIPAVGRYFICCEAKLSYSELSCLLNLEK